MTRWLLLFIWLPAVALAQEEGHEWMLDDLRACFVNAETYEDSKACMFTVSDACQAGEEGGYSTLGMSMCNRDEADAWDVLLNEEYKKTMAVFAELDADDAVYFPNLDKRVDTLRAAQRAWIAYRDAECLNEYALWGSGSMRHIIYTGCILEETAERTIELRAKREAY